MLRTIFYGQSMSNNKITHSNEGIKVLVSYGNTNVDIATLKGISAPTITGVSYNYLEISGNVVFLNDVDIAGDITAANLELLPASTKRVLFNKEGKISSSADFSWDFDTNKLSLTGELDVSSFIRGDGTYITNLKSSELDYNSITLGNTQINLGDPAVTSLSNFVSIGSTLFVGDLQGNSDTTTKLQTARTITATGDINWYVSFRGDQNVSSAATLKTISGLVAATYNSSATTVTPFTIDTKGRITGISSPVTITPSYNSITDIPSNLSTIASITGTGYLKKTGTTTWELDSSNLISETSLLDNTYYVKIGNEKFYIGKTGDEGTSASYITGLSSVTATTFYGNLNGSSTESYINVASSGIKNIILSDGYTQQELETTSTQNFYYDVTNDTLYAKKFQGNGYNINQIRTTNILNFTTDVRSQFSPGTDIQISNGTISYVGTSGATASGVAGAVQYSDGSGDLNSSSDLMWDDSNKILTIGSTNTPSTTLRVVSSITTNATIEAHGGVTSSNIQGTGVLYAGQDNRYGGGIFYSGDGSPTYAVNEATSDRISFFRRNQGTNNVVFYYSNSSNNVIFNGNITATSFFGDGSNITNIDYNNISNAPTSTSPNNSTITISAGDGLNTGGSFTTNQSSNETITLNVDSSVVRTTGIQSIYGLKEFYDKPTFWGGFEALDGYCSDDFEVQGAFFVDQSLSRVGINNTSPSYTLDVSGITRVYSYAIFGNSFVSSTGIRPASDNYYDIGNSSYRWDDVWATNGSIATSDERKKEQIENIPHGIEFLNKVRPVQYKWKDLEIVEEDGNTINKKHSRKHFGIIAQELKKTLEEQNIETSEFAAYIHDSETDSYAIRYTEFIPILIKSVQELSQENKELKKRLELLETLVSSLL